MSRTSRIKIGSISWIHQQLTPVSMLTDALLYKPNWIPKTYLGLYATKNPAPPGAVDIPSYQASKAFRAMTYAEFEVTTSDDGKSMEGVKSIKSILDPGWTPPFNRDITIMTKIYVPEPSMRDTDYHAGQLGAGSAIQVGIRHPNSTFLLNIPNDKIVASGMVIFRAGRITDDIGVKVVECPYHVPWVWCEWMLIFDNGKFQAFGTGSVFPTHSFYLNGSLYAQQDEPTDAQFVTQWRSPRTIDTSVLKVYPALVVGAPAVGPQASDTTGRATGPITSQSYVVKGSNVTSVATI